MLEKNHEKPLAGHVDFFENILGESIVRIQSSLQGNHPCNALIGRVASEWTHFEHILDEIIWDLAQLPEETALCITGHIMGATPRFKMIASLGELVGVSEDLLKKTQKLKSQQYEVAEQRNRVHDPWFVVEERGAKNLPPLTTQLKSSGYFAISETEITKTLTEIRKFVTRAVDLQVEYRQQLYALRKNSPTGDLGSAGI
jgi:hypothetical protein